MPDSRGDAKPDSVEAPSKQKQGAQPAVKPAAKMEEPVRDPFGEDEENEAALAEDGEDANGDHDGENGERATQPPVSAQSAGKAAQQAADAPDEAAVGGDSLHPAGNQNRPAMQAPPAGAHDANVAHMHLEMAEDLDVRDAGRPKGPAAGDFE